MDETRAFLRHTVATVAYRGGKAVRGAPASFASFSGDGSDRTALKILAHLGDLYDWALTQAQGAEAWKDSTPLDWDREAERFFAAVAAVRRVSRVGCAAGRISRETFSGRDRRLADPHRPARDPAAARRRANEKRELLQGRHRRRPRRAAADRAAPRIRLREPNGGAEITGSTRRNGETETETEKIKCSAFVCLFPRFVLRCSVSPC